MSKKSSAKKAAAALPTVGAIFTFNGYDTEPEKPILQKGEFVRIVAGSDDEEDAFFVARYAPTEEVEEGYTGQQELVYADELTPADESEAEEAYVEDPHNELAASPFNEHTKVTKLPKGGKKQKPETNKEPTPTKAMSKTLKVVKSAAAPESKLKKGKTAKTAKEPKVKVPKVVKEAVVIKDTKTVTAALKNKTPLEAIHEIEQKTAMSRWTLGGILSKMKREKLFLRIGTGKAALEYDDSTDGFEKFCNEQTGTGYRVAMQLVANYEHFAPLGVDEAKLAVIPWHKLKLLLHVVESKDDADEWLDKASGMTGEDLKTEVRTARIDAGKEIKARGIRTDGDSMTKISFKLFNDQSKKLRKALELAKKRCEGENPTDNDALDYIVTEWMSQFA